MIYQITPEVINNESILNYIYTNMQLHYYWSDEFSQSFYIDLAQAGFINVSIQNENDDYLLCEIQKAYAVLDFKDLYISKAVKRLMKQNRHILRFNTAFDKVMDSIQNSYEDCWMKGRYAKLLQQLQKNPNDEFLLMSCELFDTDTEQLIAGEIGYITANNVYTSLSGFSKKEKPYNNWGKLQMTLLSKYLENNGVRFWNLGHPYMQYKLALGAKILQRDEFLNRWYKKD